MQIGYGNDSNQAEAMLKNDRVGKTVQEASSRTL
jgi:hypothetical protein